MLRRALYAAAAAALIDVRTVTAQDDIPYSACPLIGAYYPAPSLTRDSEAVAMLNSTFTSAFDSLVQDSGSDKYGPISANTTSFSVVLFTGGESAKDHPAFFEYHYTSPMQQAAHVNHLTGDSMFPIGDVTMVFTVYAWLLEFGESWETPITYYLPELQLLNTDHSIVRWEEVTVGALAGQMSGLIRESGACEFGADCNLSDFIDSLTEDAFLFHPDTTPVVSYAAFQLLAFAMQRRASASSFSNILSTSIFKPLGMRSSGVYRNDTGDMFAIQKLNASQPGEQAALSVVSSINDLARVGHSILNSTLLSPEVTRRWLRVSKDTSNLRNGVGRPWEIYRSGSTPISPVLSALTKSGTIGPYASYFGVVPELNAGFAILAHDDTVADGKLDLNVYADIASEAIGYLIRLAAQEMADRFAGEFADPRANYTTNYARFNVTDNGPGLVVDKLLVKGVDMKAQYAEELGINVANLDFRLYPTNVRSAAHHQFVGVFQDESAPVDMGTPTCITWQEVGAVVEHRVVFGLGEDGTASGFEILGMEVNFDRE